MTEVLSASRQSDGSSYFSPAPLRRSPSSRSSFLVENPSSYKKTVSEPSYTHTENENRIPNSVQSSAPSSPRVSHADFSNSSAYSSTSASSLSLDSKYDDEDDDDQIAFPSYDDVGYYDEIEPNSSPQVDTSITVTPRASIISATSNSSRPESPEPLILAEDDTAIRIEPSRHVDYLAHDWKEEDLWYSWRHIVSKRKVYANSARLENASWRTWSKYTFRLGTTSPETLNWMKDCDVTWLYGPLQKCSHKHFTSSTSPPVDCLSRCNSFINKKPILKKRSMSEIMLQRSISTSSLIKQAAAAVQAQQSEKIRRQSGDRGEMSKTTSDFVGSIFDTTPVSIGTTSAVPSISSSEPHTPATGDRRHIHFNDKVEQCIAVDCKEGDDEDNDCYHTHHRCDRDSSDDEGVVMMKTSKPRRTSSKKTTAASARRNLNTDSKTIAMLPSTTLKCRGDTPDCKDRSSKFGGVWRSGVLSPSPSQETLRPSRPSSSFLVDDDADADMSWEPSGRFAKTKNGVYGSQEHFRNASSPGNGHNEGSGLRRTPSGMFMPYEEDEDDVVAAGLFGKVVDTVNTAKDIAHVIWNVGWRK